MAMGLFDSSSSSSSSTRQNHTQFSDISGSATSVAGVEASGKYSTVNVALTDQGAVNSAFQFASEQGSNSYDFARDVTASAGAAVAQSVQAVSESARTETENIFINLQKYALYGGLIWGAVMIFKGFKS